MAKFQVPGVPADVEARAADLGSEHAGRGWAATSDELLATVGAAGTGDQQYAIVAAYDNAFRVACAEAGSGSPDWLEPISAEHKHWLRGNLVNHARLAALLRVPVQRIYQEIDSVAWPEPVINKPHKFWYWWPNLEPVLDTCGLRLPADAERPPDGPSPSWWGDLPREEDFIYFLRERLLDLSGMAVMFDLDRATILRAGRFPDYPEPVINTPANHWYWESDLDRFLVRHRGDERLEGRARRRPAGEGP
jgi:hypothetical protein